MKKVFSVLLVGIIILSLAGCKKEKTISINKLNSINNIIINYFKEKSSEYENFSYNYVDEEAKVVVVGLKVNSKKEQDWFKENIVNSKYIKFEQGYPDKDNSFSVIENIEKIIKNGPQTSSSPFDYIKASQNEYDELLNHPEDTFEYAIEDLLKTNAGDGLKSYIEALLCKEINKDFEYDFESAIDYLNSYKEYIKNSSKLSEYDNYVKSLLN